MKKPNKQQQSLKTRMKPAFRVLIFSGIVLAIAFTVIFIYGNLGTPKKAHAGLGMLGDMTVSSTNVILNEFTTLTANASAGATSITVASSGMNSHSRFSGNLAVGELVMIIQMQGATMTTSSTTSSTWGAVSAYNSAGEYEFDQVASVPNSTTITLVSGLKNSYTSSGNVQVVRVPRYDNFTINSGASITTDAWNGSTGGIIAIEADSNTTINGTINVSGLGFRGGNVQNNSTCCYDGSDASTYATTSSSKGAAKGEGIGGDSVNYITLGGLYGRGAPANGGGGGSAHNAGGGGGANGNNSVTWNGLGNPDTTTVSTWKTAWDLESSNFHKNTSSGGGRGGYSYSANNYSALTYGPGNSKWSGDDRSNVGGLGGRPLTNGGSLTFLGGGGGAGDSNNDLGTSGANGGGIVYILSGAAVTGTGTINASGAGAATSTTPGGQANPNGDGSGGGGGGGSVIIYTPGAAISNLTITANGGAGGSQNIDVVDGGDSLEAEGGGGGGGGGYIATTNANSLTLSAVGGSNGTTNSLSVTAFPPNGATKGASGVTVLNPPSPYSGVVALPIELVNFSGQEKNNSIEITWTTASEINSDFFTLEKSDNGYDFVQIAKVKGAGNSNHIINYSYNDDSQLKGDNYYRLSQTDYNGRSTTFNPIHIKINQVISGNIIIGVGPVPFNDHLRIDYSIAEGGAVQFSIYNNFGQQVSSNQVQAGLGINSFMFDDVASLPEGIYYIMMKHGEDTAKAIKVLKI